MVILFCRPAVTGSERIVSLAPAITEIVYAFSMEDRLVGVTDYCDYPDEARMKESVGGFINPNLEKIIALDPDVVVVSKNGGLKGITRKLHEFGIPVSIVAFYSLADLYDAFRTVAALGDIPERGDAEVRRFTEKIAACRTALTGVPPVKVIFIRWRDPLSVAANGSLEDEIITVAGGTNIVAGSRTRYPVYTAEAIALAAPDVIIDASYYNTPTAAERAEIARFWQKFAHLAAVKHDQVYIMRTDLHSVPGPRTIQFIDEMAYILHPDLFTTTWGLSERIDI